MKKFLIVAALVGMVAAPAFAGLAPSFRPDDGFDSYVDVRSAAYAPNDSNHMYDHMQGSTLPTPPGGNVGGPEPSAGRLIQATTSRGIWHYVRLKPNATAISSIHMLVDQRPSGTFNMGAANVQFMLYPVNPNATQVGSVIGSPLLTTGGSTAVFTLPTATPGTVNMLQLTFPPVPVTTRDIWIGFQADFDIGVRISAADATDFDGDVGDALNGANHIGTAYGTFATCYGMSGECGVGLFQYSQITQLFQFGGANSIHLTLGGTPEPASICLLAGGLFALRRRKVRA